MRISRIGSGNRVLGEMGGCRDVNTKKPAGCGTGRAWGEDRARHGSPGVKDLRLGSTAFEMHRFAIIMICLLAFGCGGRAPRQAEVFAVPESAGETKPAVVKREAAVEACLT